MANPITRSIIKRVLQCHFVVCWRCGKAIVITMNVGVLVSLLAMFSTTAKAWTFTTATRRRPLLTWSLQTRMMAITATSATDVSGDESAVQVPKKFVPYPFEYRQDMTLRVSSLTNLGLGVCRTPIQVDNNAINSTTQQDWVIMVPNVIPGELVRVRIYRNHKSYSDADVLEIVEPSPHRIQPACPLSQECGGCQYQHMDIELQRQYKTQHVREVLERIGDIENPNVLPTVGTDEIYHYRSKITPHYDRPQKRKSSNNRYEIGPIGFKQKSSRRLVDVDYCHIATDAINNRLRSLRDEKRNEAQEGRLKRPKRGATLLLRDVHTGDNENAVVTDPKQFVTTTVGDLTFGFLAGNFFQNNNYMLPVMVDHVVAAATKHVGDGQPREMTHLIDCYCGSGLFSLSCSANFDTCVGIEVNDKAVVEATANAELNNITNCAFVAASAEAIFESKHPVLDKDNRTVLIRDFPRESTVVVVDPPRKGCSEEFLEQLYAYGPQRVVYMSCDPATQARDAKGLLQHGYEITSVQPFDLFPQTRHIECLVVFERPEDVAID